MTVRLYYLLSPDQVCPTLSDFEICTIWLKYSQNCNWQIICTIEIPNLAHTMLDWGLFQFKCTLVYFDVTRGKEILDNIPDATESERSRLLTRQLGKVQ